MKSNESRNFSDAEICRQNNWNVGDCLRGVEIFGNGSKHESIIKITAIGEKSILAKQIKPVEFEEANWPLKHRNWEKL